ncbi:MAG TPA: hypothetical protein VEQ63_05015, partial [Bryobacteraceae bacterium]|nr:hypothetical protein [Bryobacteraceae bacterium]
VPKTLVNYKGLGRPGLQSGAAQAGSQVDLYAERSFVRDSAKRNLYTGKTYNSVDNISQFFAERGMPAPSGIQQAQAKSSTVQPASQGLGTPPASVPRPAAPRPGVAPTGPAKNGAPAVGVPNRTGPQTAGRPAQGSLLPPIPAGVPAGGQRKKGFGAGSAIVHPKYGRGTVLRREGDGDDAKLTVSFPGYGLKKLVEKFAGLKVEE